MNVRSRFPVPFVKWAGGKSQILPQITMALPKKFGRYYEPFVGGGAVFFSLRPNDATISDANFELINAYRVVRDDLRGLLHEIGNLQKLRISRTLYNKFRDMDPETLTSHKRAARFILLNKTCYNGLYRVNRNGEFNVPFGKYRRMPKLCDENNLREIQSLLQNTELVFSNYEVPLRRAKAGDFIYLDPPYSPEPETTGFVSYTKKSFSASDQTRLASKFKELHRRGCLIMLSNSDTKLVRELYSEFRATSLQITAGRMINCVGSERMGYRELLVLNYPPPMETLAPWVRQPN